MESLGAGDNMKRVVTGDYQVFYMNVANSHARYARLLDQQERILKKGRDFKALCEGLKSFPNISKVCAFVGFNLHPNYYPRRGRSLDEYIKGNEWYSSRSNFEFGLTVPPSRWCGRPECQDEGQLDQEQHIKWNVRGLPSLFRAVSPHCLSPKELRIGSINYKAPMAIFKVSDTDTKNLCTTARCLTTLRFHPYVTISDDSPEYAKQQHCLDRILQEAKELRILSSSRRHLEEEWDDENEDLNLSERTDFGMFLTCSLGRHGHISAR